MMKKWGQYFEFFMAGCHLWIYLLVSCFNFGNLFGDDYGSVDYLKGTFVTGVLTFVHEFRAGFAIVRPIVFSSTVSFQLISRFKINVEISHAVVDLDILEFSL